MKTAVFRAAVSGPAVDRLISRFAALGRRPFGFQVEAWRAYLDGASGLVLAAPGMGKTLAALGGPAAEALAGEADGDEAGLRLLWITPMRALATDTLLALSSAMEKAGLPWTAGARTGDTPAAERRRQERLPPHVLVTTPESLALWFTRPEAPSGLRFLRSVVVDEWHDLMGTKRGVMVELLMARLRGLVSGLRVWGLSATMAEPQEAMEGLLGPTGPPGFLVRGPADKPMDLRAVIPHTMDRFPWAGHLGLNLLPAVLEAVAAAGSTLIFTNTRSQAEQWYRAILDARPSWAGRVGIHHGSVSESVRLEVEAGLRTGRLRAVVCTSSLDLGVDYPPVDQVVQIGSPKGIGRLRQRAGRSGHRPGRPSRVLFVPSHAFELAEIAAVRNGMAAGRLERRRPVQAAMDVLAQHLLTLSLGGGFEAEAVFEEIKNTYSFHNFERKEFDWLLNFISTGGPALSAYPDYRRAEPQGGRFRMTDPRLVRRHRMNIGTIGDDPAVRVAYRNGAFLGTVEEAFAARLRRKDRFIFAGQVLEAVRLREGTLTVRKAGAAAGPVPRWMGGRMPLSTDLAAEVRRVFHAAASGHLEGPEMQALQPVFALQGRWSSVPSENELLVEAVKTREDFHRFLFPFEGRGVHEGLAALFAWRISRWWPMTLSFAVNDYGIELLSDREVPFEEALGKGLLSPENLEADLLSAVNAAELARRHFREIARISGLVAGRLPGRRPSANHLQASAGLLFTVLDRYDPENRLIRQARREVLEVKLERGRLADSLGRMSLCRVKTTHPPKVTPMAFPIWVDRIRASVSSEQLAERLERMLGSLNRLADEGGWP